jgi:hypothetical protein
LKNNSVLFVEFAGAEFVNDFVWVNDAIENRDVEIDEEAVGGLDVRGVFIANEFFWSLVSPAFGMKSDRTDALGKNKELLTAGQAPLNAGVVNVRMNSGDTRQQWHNDIHLFDRKLVGLNVLCADAVEEQQQKEYEEYQQG